jgi:hypothetical protein
MKKTLIIIFLTSAISFAQSAGNSGLSFLKFGFGARNIAMGDAGVAASNDLSALFYNPSRLVSTEMNEVMFMHNEWIQDVRSEVGGIKWNMFKLPWAIGFNVTTTGELEFHDESPGEPISYFSWNYFFGSLSSGFTIIDDLDFGATIKYLYEGVINDEAAGFGFDFGLNYSTPIKGLTASTVIRNVGSMSELKVEKTKLPTEFRLGGAYNFGLKTSMLDFIIVGEFQKYLATEDIHLIGGGEIVYNETFAARVGYQSGYEARNFTGGVGIMWGNLRFDYAYMPLSQGLGSANLFSIQFKF